MSILQEDVGRGGSEWKKKKGNPAPLSAKIYLQLGFLHVSSTKSEHKFLKWKKNLSSAPSEFSWEKKKIVKRVIILLTSVNEPESFEKHHQLPTLSLCRESGCICNVDDDSGSNYTGLDGLHIAYKLFLNLCSLRLATGRRPSLTIIHPSTFILSDRSFCNRYSMMCWNIWMLSSEGKQKNTPFRFPCGPYCLSCSTKTPALLPLSRSSVKACFVIQGSWLTCNLMLVSVRTKENIESFCTVQDAVWNYSSFIFLLSVLRGLCIAVKCWRCSF